MKKLLMLVAVAVLVASPALAARQNVPYTGTYPAPTHTRTADIELEYDGGVFVAYGTSPNWTDDTAVNFQIPSGGPFLLAEVRYYTIGTTNKNVQFWDGGGLSDPPTNLVIDALPWNSGYSVWPPTDWTTVDVTSLAQVVQTGDIVRPGLILYGDNDGIGLAYAGDDGNPGHSWALYGGTWTDDTYGYGYDDGIRLGINYSGTPTESTTWGAVKNMFR
jgi:hypothetical protein